MNMNKKIKVAVVGVHGFGSFHVDGFSKNANAELVGEYGRYQYR